MYLVLGFGLVVEAEGGVGVTSIGIRIGLVVEAEEGADVPSIGIGMSSRSERRCGCT